MVSTSRRTDKKTLYLVSADSINVDLEGLIETTLLT